MRHAVLVFLLLLVFATPAGTAGESQQRASGAASGPEEFRPSTRLPADQAIAFPVDI